MPCDHMSFESADQPYAEELGGFGAAALRYQRMGYAVLPLARGGKRPHRMLGEAGGVHWATRDPAMVWWAWRTDPAANVGVAAGSASGGLLVLDLDAKDGHSGAAELATLTGAWSLPLPPAPSVATPSGGAHMWLNTGDWRLPNRTGLAPGIDVRAEGGLVAVPPSRLMVEPRPMPGDPPGAGSVAVPYWWTPFSCPCEVPAAPGWVLDWITNAPGTGTMATGRPGYTPTLEQAVKEGLPRGQRNDQMYRLACSLLRRGLDRESAAGELHRVWETTDRTDFGWREVLACLASAANFIESEEQKFRAQRLEWLARMGVRRG